MRSHDIITPTPSSALFSFPTQRSHVPASHCKANHHHPWTRHRVAASAHVALQPPTSAHKKSLSCMKSQQAISSPATSPAPKCSRRRMCRKLQQFAPRNAASLYGRPAPGTSTRVESTRPVLAEDAICASAESPVSMKSVLPSSPPSMHAKQS